MNFVAAQTSVASFFSDGMVLQHQQQLQFWGKDTADTPIQIETSWGATASAITNEDGKWRITLASAAAGGPYSIKIKGSSVVLINDIMIGEVWICAGQSNMQMPVEGSWDGNNVHGGLNAIVNSKNDNIRVFTAAQNASFTPKDDAVGKWEKAAPSTTGGFSAVGYFFAEQLEKTLDVPVGIIVTAWGGSSAEAWTDKETLESLNISIPNQISESEQLTPNVLYNAMLRPIIGYGIKGILWYQGEANRINAHIYESLVNSMVTSWRKQWGLGDFPFYFAQIAPYNYGLNNSAFLREAQFKTSQSLKNTEMVVTLDVGDCTEIHPAYKMEVGRRMSYIALAKDYGFSGFDFKSPVPTKWCINDKEIVLTFSNRVRLKKGSDIPKNFEIAGADNVFYTAKATMPKPYKNTQNLRVYSKQVTNPKVVRYGFKNCVTPTLFGRNGLPVSSFRTDNLQSDE